LAYQNFKQTFWSKHIQHELKKRAILADFCNTEFTGEAKYGNQVKVLGVGRPSIGNYLGTDIGTPETVEDSSVFLPIDKAKYFNFMVDDVDKAQSVPGLMEALMEEATLAMALQIDSDIAEIAGKNAGAYSNSLQIDSAADAKSAIDAGILKLRENDVPLDADVVMEIPPFVYAYLKEKYIDLDTDNTEMLRKGIMGRYDGVKVRVSNNLYNDNTDDYCLIRTKKAVAYVNQIDKVEPYRPEGLFSDAIKGLNVYGAKVVRPKELYVIRAHK
jgi:hypothetical protein